MNLAKKRAVTDNEYNMFLRRFNKLENIVAVLATIAESWLDFS